VRVRAPSQNKIKRKTRSFCCSRLKNEEMKGERRRPKRRKEIGEELLQNRRRRFQERGGRQKF
jgi:hypothetical protein